MAEFCLDCWNEINGTNDPPSKYIISRHLDLCEGCGEWKHVIIKERGRCFLYGGTSRREAGQTRHPGEEKRDLKFF